MGRADYLLRRDVGKSGTGLQDLWGESLDQQAGINKYRGIGRGLGTLGGILLAGSGAGIPLLALAGGLGSFGGSQIGKHLGQQRYGDPVKAEKGGLFHRDVAKEQRESVGDYWKGMKEQIAVNTLQDAITAGMYGSQIQKFAGMGKPMAAPMTPNVPISSPAQPQMLGDEALSQLTSNWSPDALQMTAPKPPLKPAMPAVDFPASVATPELLGNVPINQISGMQGYTPWEPLKEQYNPYGAFYNSIINKYSAPSSAGSAVMGNQYRGQQIMFE
jgi:hypothetical protein